MSDEQARRKQSHERVAPTQNIKFSSMSINLLPSVEMVVGVKCKMIKVEKSYPIFFCYRSVAAI